MRGRLLTVTIAVGALTAACSSGSSGHGAGGSSASGSPNSTAAAAVTVAVAAGHLTATDGHTLYYNTVDTATSIGCVGSCASTWPPLLGQPTAGAGVSSGDLGTAARPGGVTQVTFQGHPLYEFAGDAAAGSTKGSGLTDGGGRWVVATVGSTPARSPASSTSGGGGGGYGGY
ncbi:MAG: hypothetical protein J0H43_08010 [Actinobacteria bacterium]|nr:hypothetical protein [Actinomycetota bacterium]